MYDFDLRVNDTLTLASPNKIKLKLDSVRQQFIYGKDRRIQYFTRLDRFTNIRIALVEGIGFTSPNNIAEKEYVSFELNVEQYYGAFLAHPVPYLSYLTAKGVNYKINACCSCGELISLNKRLTKIIIQ